MSNIVVFYDTEYTSWEGAMDNDWKGPGQYRELVQIGALRFDLDTLEAKEEFLILIKPVRNPQLSAFFTQLTGITQADIERDALDFPDAYRAFRAFAGACPTAAYGLDARVVRENLGFNAMPDTEAEFDSHNIGPWFHEQGAAHGITKGINSGRLAAAVGAEMSSIQEHNALHDARSIAAAYRFLIGKNARPFFAGKL
ncbi:MAG: exonuclease domain-containing protein [Micavibrio sp.]|nr:exonuclease domain-containing protein [Micavibrio sp.]